MLVVYAAAGRETRDGGCIYLLSLTKTRGRLTRPRQPPSGFLAWESACARLRRPFPTPAGSKRYNTLDFLAKVVCQRGLCPLWIPLPRGPLFPSGHLLPTGASRPYWMTPRQRGRSPLWTPRCLGMKQSSVSGSKSSRGGMMKPPPGV